GQEGKEVSGDGGVFACMICRKISMYNGQIRATARSPMPGDPYKTAPWALHKTCRAMRPELRFVGQVGGLCPASCARKVECFMSMAQECASGADSKQHMPPRTLLNETDHWRRSLYTGC